MQNTKKGKLKCYEMLGLWRVLSMAVLVKKGILTLIT